MPICQADRWMNEECHNAHCSTFQVGYVYGLLDARIGDIFYVGSTFQAPGTRYQGHMQAGKKSNFREAWILAILADGSLPVLLGVCTAGQDLENASPTALTTDLQIAREALTNAVANIDIMLHLVAQAEDLFSQ